MIFILFLFGYIVYSNDMCLIISDIPCGSVEALDILKILLPSTPRPPSPTTN
jgi:hypothetical protein